MGGSNVTLDVDLKRPAQNKSPAPAPAAADRANWPPAGDGGGWFQIVAVLFLTANSVAAIHHSWGVDVWNVVFVASAYVNLLLLFGSLRIYDKTPRDARKRRGWLKVAVWVLSTTLIASFSYHVARIMPFLLAVGIYCLAVFVAVAGFVALFICSEKGVEEEHGRATTAILSKYAPGDHV